MPPSHEHDDLVDGLRESAAEEGFVCFGIAPAVESTGFSDLVRWIDAGYAGEMHYLPERKEAYRHPDSVLNGVRSLIVLAYPYEASERQAVEPGYGRVARYAWSDQDYHDVVHPKLRKLCRLIHEYDAGSHARGVIDTAPLLEREFAQLAGIGWRGKNTLLLNKEFGSYFFLASVLTDLTLPYDEPHSASHCGTCTACLDACPTDAFPQPGVLDATRCISYLTIEHRGEIAGDLREDLGDWVFGCDVCQEVCPWNRKPARAAESRQQTDKSILLENLLSLNEEEFRQHYRKTPMWRTRRRGMLRNAAIVLGNQSHTDAEPSLRKACDDEDELVRDAATWALKRTQCP